MLYQVSYECGQFTMQQMVVIFYNLINCFFRTIPGHCSVECGQFTMQQMVEVVQEASSWIRNRTREGAVITVGQGLGGKLYM
jgi:hypothetical protein